MKFRGNKVAVEIIEKYVTGIPGIGVYRFMTAFYLEHPPGSNTTKQVYLNTFKQQGVQSHRIEGLVAIPIRYWSEWSCDPICINLTVIYKKEMQVMDSPKQKRTVTRTWPLRWFSDDFPKTPPVTTPTKGVVQFTLGLVYRYRCLAIGTWTPLSLGGFCSV